MNKYYYWKVSAIFYEEIIFKFSIKNIETKLSEKDEINNYFGKDYYERAFAQNKNL